MPIGNGIAADNIQQNEYENKIAVETAAGLSTTYSSSLKRNISHGKLMNTDVKEVKVRVIYTGGTIGMVRNERNGKCCDKFSLIIF